MVRFSIIIPIYNVKDYLSYCLDSVVNQNFEDYEMILVNDGSTDASEELCKIYKNKYSNKKIHYYYKKNGGLSDARNYGINKANGEYLIFLDSDDMLNENTLLSLNNLILKYNYPEIIVQNYEFLDNSTLRRSKSNFLFDFDEKLFLNISEFYNILINNKSYLPTAWNVVVKKKLLMENTQLYFVKGILHEDEQWTPRVILSSKSALYVNKVHYIYRINRDDSIMGTKNLKSIIDKLYICDSLSEFSSSLDEISKRVIDKRINQLITGILMGFIRDYQNNDNKELIKALSKKSKILKCDNNYKHRLLYVFFNIKYNGKKGLKRF